MKTDNSNPIMVPPTLRLFDFFTAEAMPGRTPGSGATLRSDRVTAMEKVDGANEFHVGTSDGLVHRVRVDAEGFSVDGSFPAIEVEPMGPTMGSRSEVFRIGHLERVGVTSGAGRASGAREGVASAVAGVQRSAAASPPANDGPSISRRASAIADTSSSAKGSSSSRAIGQRLYAMLGDAAARTNTASIEEILVVVGNSRSNIVLRAWEVSRAKPDSRKSPDLLQPLPRLLAHKSVFKALKLLDSDIESVAVNLDEWPTVYVAVGTASGGIYVFCCGNVNVGTVAADGDASGLGTSSSDFVLVRSMDTLKIKFKAKHSKAIAKPDSNRIHFVSFARRGARGTGDPAGLIVWGASEHGDVIGFEALGDSRATIDKTNTDSMILEEVSGALKRGCVAVDERGALALATRDGIFYYTIQEGRTVAASVHGGEKHAVVALGDGYLLILSDSDEDRQQHRQRGPVRQVSLRIVHVDRKIVASSMSLPGPIRVATVRPAVEKDTTWSLLAPMTTLYALDGTGSMHRIVEKPLRSQIDTLCDAKLFLQALRLCERAHSRMKRPGTDSSSPSALSARVNTLYGDYLFHSGALEAAMDAYMNTIGIVETSHVIQKFLEGGAMEMGQLARYLDALMNKGVATGDHVSLLMQVYLDNNETSNIDDLVERLCLRCGKVAASLDAKAIIDVLRLAGFARHALDIAKAYGEHDMYVSILVNERRAYEEALAYLGAGPRAYAAAQLLRHGKVLIEHASEATTALIMGLCIPPEHERHDDAYVADLSSFAQLFAERPQDFQRVCQTILDIGDVDGVAGGRDVSGTSPRGIIYQSLLDIYLGDVATDPSKAKAATPLDLLCRGWPPGHEPAYDPNVALTSCAVRGYHEGIVFIHIRMRRYREALRTLASISDWPAVLAVCRVHGPSDSSLWHLALQALVSYIGGPAGEETTSSLKHLAELLEAIDEASSMAPLSVLDELVKHPALPFGVVKNHFLNILRREEDCIDANSAEMEVLAKKVTTTRESLDRLRARPIVFKATRDASSGAVLQVPVVHLLCGHSFNTDSGMGPMDGLGMYGNGELTNLAEYRPTIACPLCAEEQDRIGALLASSRASSCDQDGFFRQLESAQDSLAFVSTSVSRRLL